MVCGWVKAADLPVSFVGAHPVRDGFQGVCHAHRPRGGLPQHGPIAHGVGSHNTGPSPTGWAPTKSP